MISVCKSFGFKAVTKDTGELTHATIGDELLISEIIPMSFNHHLVIQNAIERAYAIGRRMACDEIREQLDAVEICLIKASKG